MTDPLLIATLLGQRAMRRYAAIEEASGISFSRAHPQLMMFPEPGDEGTSSARRASRAYRQIDALLANSRDLATVPEVLDQGELAERFPQLRLPSDQVGLLQHDALIVNPRRLVAARSGDPVRPQLAVPAEHEHHQRAVHRPRR